LPFPSFDFECTWWRRVWRYQRGVTRIHKSKKDMYRQNNDQKKKDKSQTTIYKTLHRKLKSSNTNPIKNRGELRCSRRVSSSCSTSDTRRVTDKRHKHHMTWKPCWTPVCVNKYKKTFNKTWTLYIRNGSKDESNIVFM
jgi:hypothetical protein